MGTEVLLSNDDIKKKFSNCISKHLCRTSYYYYYYQTFIQSSTYKIIMNHERQIKPTGTNHYFSCNVLF